MFNLDAGTILSKMHGNSLIAEPLDSLRYRSIVAFMFAVSIRDCCHRSLCFVLLFKFIPFFSEINDSVFDRITFAPAPSSSFC